MCALMSNGSPDTPKPAALVMVAQPKQQPASAGLSRHFSRRELIRRARELGIHR